MRWEKHGDFHIGVDSKGWRRAIVYLEHPGYVCYYAITTLGAVTKLRETSHSSLAVAKREAARQVKEDGYK